MTAAAVIGYAIVPGRTKTTDGDPDDQSDDSKTDVLRSMLAATAKRAAMAHLSRTLGDVFGGFLPPTMRQDQPRKVTAMSDATHDELSVVMDPDPPAESTKDLVQQRAVELGRSATAWVVEHPELSLCLGLALGVGVGLAVKRR